MHATTMCNFSSVRESVHATNEWGQTRARSWCWGTQYFKKIPTITQDLSRRCLETRGESVSTYPRRPKAEAFSNAVDVVERLRDPTDPSTERTAPPRSAHVQLDDVPRTLDPVEAEGEFRQHDGVATVMMKLPAQGFA